MDKVDDPLDVLLTEKEVARICGVVEGTLQNWRYKSTNPGPPFVRIGGTVRYRKSDLRNWMESLDKGSK